MFGHRMTAIINKPVDHIFINSLTTNKFKTGIIKSDISTHFSIFFVACYNIHKKETEERYISRRGAYNIFPSKNTN